MYRPGSTWIFSHHHQQSPNTPQGASSPTVVLVGLWGPSPIAHKQAQLLGPWPHSRRPSPYTRPLSYKRLQQTPFHISKHSIYQWQNIIYEQGPFHVKENAQALDNSPQSCPAHRRWSIRLAPWWIVWLQGCSAAISITITTTVTKNTGLQKTQQYRRQNKSRHAQQDGHSPEVFSSS